MCSFLPLRYPSVAPRVKGCCGYGSLPQVRFWKHLLFLVMLGGVPASERSQLVLGTSQIRQGAQVGSRVCLLPEGLDIPLLGAEPTVCCNFWAGGFCSSVIRVSVLGH